MGLIESFSGIRGIFGEELTEEIAVKYGRAYFEFLKAKTENPVIVIGRDTRQSGEALLTYLMQGINCKIINIGISSTPITENAVRAFGADGGIIITSSHNEPQFNGFKFLEPNGAQLSQEKSNFVINLAHKMQITDFGCDKRKIEFKEKDALEAYNLLLKEVIKTNKINSNAKILVDTNGGTGFIAEEIFKKFGISAVCINTKIREFKRLVEPTQSSLSYLKEKIIENNCDFAIGFDCDADRAEYLLKDGTLVSGNHIIALVAKPILANPLEENKAIVVNDGTSYCVKEAVQEYNANWVEVEVGEANVVNKMIELNAMVGGEGSSGGVIISPSKCRDGIMAVLFLLKLMSETNKSIEDLISALPRYYYLKEKLQLAEDFTKIRNRVKFYYLENGFSVQETGDETGGMKFIKDNSWIWFRQSKTESGTLRIFTDSKSEETAKSLMEEGKRIVLEN